MTPYSMSGMVPAVVVKKLIRSELAQVLYAVLVDQDELEICLIWSSSL